MGTHLILHKLSYKDIIWENYVLVNRILLQEFEDFVGSCLSLGAIYILRNIVHIFTIFYFYENCLKIGRNFLLKIYGNAKTVKAISRANKCVNANYFTFRGKSIQISIFLLIV